MAIGGKARDRVWETVWGGLTGMETVFAADPRQRALAAIIRISREFVADQFQQVDAGKPMVCYNLGFHSELVYALGDVGAVCAAQAAAMSSLFGEVEDTEALIDLAGEHGYSADCCSADKAAIGGIIDGLYPQPSCVVGINTPCDSQVSLVQAMAERYNTAPLYVIDVPTYDDDRTIRHVAQQLEGLIPFLERHTGRRLDWDRLRAVCERTNQTSQYLWDWMDLRSVVPTMQPSYLSCFTMALMIMFSGSDWGVQLARALCEDAREKVESEVRYFDERVRAIWYQDPVWWDIQIYNWMEAKLGLTIPMDIFGYYSSEGWIDTATPESMLFGLARRMVNCHPMSRQFRGTMKRYIDDFLYLHERFHADCGILAGHLGCKHSWGGIGLFKEALRRAGVPLLVFEFDIFDSRVLTYRELQFEIERFVTEIVLPRKRRGELSA